MGDWRRVEAPDPAAIVAGVLLYVNRKLQRGLDDEAAIDEDPVADP